MKQTGEAEKLQCLLGGARLKQVVSTRVAYAEHRAAEESREPLLLILAPLTG